MSETAVVAAPHSVKGECVYCFVTTRQGVEWTDQLKKQLILKGGSATSSAGLKRDLCMTGLRHLSLEKNRAGRNGPNRAVPTGLQSGTGMGYNVE